MEDESRMYRDRGWVEIEDRMRVEDRVVRVYIESGICLLLLKRNETSNFEKKEVSMIEGEDNVIMCTCQDNLLQTSVCL